MMPTVLYLINPDACVNGKPLSIQCLDLDGPCTGLQNGPQTRHTHSLCTSARSAIDHREDPASSTVLQCDADTVADRGGLGRKQQVQATNRTTVH